jgi:hypothetical protein
MTLHRSFIGGAITAGIITLVFLAPRTEPLDVGARLRDAGRLPALAETTEPTRTVPSTNLNAVESAPETLGGDDLARNSLRRDTVFGTDPLTLAVQQNRGARSSGVEVDAHEDNEATFEGETKPISEPECWQLTSNLPQSFYTVIQDKEQVFSGESSARIESMSSRAQFGTLSQTINASAFAGKRIEFSAFVRLEGVVRGVSLWVLATDAAGGITVSQRLDWIPGSLDWHSRNIVVDVPVQSVALTYAFNILGEGTLWVDAARVAALDGASAPNGRRGSLVAPDVASLPVSSLNTDFEAWDTDSGQQRHCAAEAA